MEDDLYFRPIVLISDLATVFFLLNLLIFVDAFGFFFWSRVFSCCFMCLIDVFYFFFLIFGVIWLQAVIKQLGGTGYESSNVMVIDEVELQRHQQLEKLYRSTRAGRVRKTIALFCCGYEFDGISFNMGNLVFLLIYWRFIVFNSKLYFAE